MLHDLWMTYSTLSQLTPQEQCQTYCSNPNPNPYPHYLTYIVRPQILQQVLFKASLYLTYSCIVQQALLILLIPASILQTLKLLTLSSKTIMFYHKMTIKSLIFSRPSSVFFLLHWDYTGVYNLRFFMVSEVDFCNDHQPPDETQITFQVPQSDNSMIILTIEELTGTGNTTINCTVSSSGLFEWH